MSVDDVKATVAKFNIQFDNLCQFLPQDKVVEFARMDAYELLVATEKALGDSKLYTTHKELIDDCKVVFAEEQVGNRDRCSFRAVRPVVYDVCCSVHRLPALIVIAARSHWAMHLVLSRPASLQGLQRIVCMCMQAVRREDASLGHAKQAHEGRRRDYEKYVKYKELQEEVRRSKGRARYENMCVFSRPSCPMSQIHASAKVVPYTVLSFVTLKDCVLH